MARVKGNAQHIRSVISSRPMQGLISTAAAFITLSLHSWRWQ